MIENDIVDEIKEFVNRNNLAGMEEQWIIYSEYTDFGRDIAWDYVFQKVYLHACLKQRREIVKWLDGMYELFNPAIKVAMRQMFPYARTLLNKRR